MAIKIKQDANFTLWFVTFTCFNWLNLFELTKSYDIVYKWFYKMREKEIAEVVSYVIMPNHLHIILQISNNENSLNTIISNGKRFIAYEIIKRIKANENKSLQLKLSLSLSDREKKKGQKHKVFIESFDSKAIYSNKFLHQKMDYIHHNPVNKKWHLVEDHLNYEHSSASYYMIGIVKHFEPMHFKNIF
jgi:putative transposase